MSYTYFDLIKNVFDDFYSNNYWSTTLNVIQLEDLFSFCIFLKKTFLGLYLAHLLCIYGIIQVLAMVVSIIGQRTTILYLKSTLLLLVCIIFYSIINYICQNIYIFYLKNTNFLFDALLTANYYILIYIFIFSFYGLYLYNQAILKIKNKLIWDINSEILLLLNIATYLNLKIITCGNLLYFIILIESLTLLLIVVCVSMGFLKEDLKSAEEAGFKLYINNAVSTGFLLLGISLIYGCTGLINIADISFFLNNILNTGFSSNFFFNIKDFLLIIGFIFFLVGIFTKMMQSPFHLWAKDIYEGSSFYFTGYLATISKVGILFFFVNSILLFNKCDILMNLCLYLGIFSTFIGILGSLQQKKFKSFIAYTSIAAIGPLLIICGVSPYIYNINIISNIVLPYILSYIGIVLFLFIIIGRLGKIHIYNYNTIKHSKIKTIRKFTFIQLKELSEFAGLWFKHKSLTILILILLLTLIAIPPFFNFLLKTYILLVFVKTSNLVIAFIFLLYGVIGCLYYLKIIKLMIFDHVNNHIYILKTTFFANLISTTCILFLTIGFMYPKIVLNLFFNLN